MFFTPPRLAPLDLDVVSLSGGGWAPAQFEGQTSDGKNVYCRYRGGWLGVHISRTSGGEAYREGEVLLHVGIGPGLHGALSLWQVCRYAGITIAGQLPPMPTASEIAEDGLLDLSGDTTFMQFNAISSEATGLRFYDAILDRFPDLIAAKPTWKAKSAGLRSYDAIFTELTTEGWDKVSAKQDRAAKLHYLPCRTSTNPAGWSISFFRPITPRPPIEQAWPIEIVDFDSFGARMFTGIICHNAYDPPFRSSHFNYTDLIAGAGRQLQFVRSRDGFPADNLWLRLQFPTGDRQGRELANDIHQLALEHYPIEPILAFDLCTGERIPEKDQCMPLDPKIREWMRGEHDRWLVGYRETDGSRRYVGCRPANV
jgi:hypothetical protein